MSMATHAGAVASGTLSVNAAFFQEIKDDNRQLARLIAYCQALFSPPLRRIRWQRRVTALRRLRDQLAMHFALEDAYGYFEDALDAAPRLTDEAEQLRREHDTLFLEVCELVELAEQALYREPTDCTARGLSVRFLAFHRWLEEHESRETALIMAAVNDDIGVGD